MSDLIASPGSKTFQLDTKHDIRVSDNEKHGKSPALVLEQITHHDQDFKFPQTIQRHSTLPSKSSDIEHRQNRQVQTGFSLPKTHSTLSHNSHKSSLWRRVFERTYGKDGSQPAPGTSRQSTMDTKHSASFEQTIPWDQKAILSLDGGGIRGYSALLIIQELMKKIQAIEEGWPQGNADGDGPAYSSYHPVDPIQATSTGSAPDINACNGISTAAGSSLFLPCHYFDYMAGTSTGGLISIMLGRLRMNVDECIQEYETLGGKVFGKSRWFHLRSIPPFWLPREKYNHKTLEGVIQRLVDRRIPKIGGFPGGKMFAFDENRCRVVVVAYQENPGSGTEKTYLFRTYKNLKKAPNGLDRNPGPAHDISIWEVARATSAAPGYFKEVTIGDLKYLDGGFGANNPCLEIFREVSGLNNYDKKCIGCVISIGTGKNNEKRIQSKTGFREAFKTGLGKFIHYENFARKWASDSEGPHFNMLDLRQAWEESGQSFNYFRLNVEEGLAHMKLDEWKSRGTIRMAFGRCIGMARSKASHNKPSKPVTIDTGNEKSPKLSHDTNSQSDRSSSTFLTSQASKDSYDIDVYQHIPEFLRPNNKTLATIRTQTQSYLNEPDCQRWLQDCAKYLVENRRARVKADPERWQKTCFGTWYQCQVRGCQRGQAEYPDARTMEKHLLDKHRDVFSKASDEERTFLEQAVKSFRITVH